MKSSTVRGVVPHATGGSFTQPGNTHDNKSNTKTEGLYQQPGNPTPMGGHSPVISEQRYNG